MEIATDDVYTRNRRVRELLIKVEPNACRFKV